MNSQFVKFVVIHMSLFGTLLAFNNCSQFKTSSEALLSEDNSGLSQPPVCTSGATQSGYLMSSVLYPVTCGALVTKTCVDGQWNRTETLAAACKQQCVHPQTSQPVDAGTLHTTYSITQGASQAACDAAKVTSTCDQATGRFLPAPAANTTCLVQGQTCAYTNGAGLSVPTGNAAGSTVTGFAMGSATYPALCGAQVTRTCQVNGTWTGTTPVYTACSQKCVHPDTSMPADSGSTYVYYTISTGTQSQCDAARVTSTCQSNSGLFSPSIIATRYASCTVIVAPTVSSFQATPSAITVGQSSTLSWTVSNNATSLTLNPGSINVTGKTTQAVSPTATTSYTLTATNTAGSTNANVNVTVNPASGGGPNAVIPGAITTPFPTLENITVEWAFTNDQNFNSSVNVRYRKMGDSAWKTGMPLKLVRAGTGEGFSWGTRHSGSVFDLQPATTYQIELSINDPDGGSTASTVTATTRPVPVPMAGAPVKTVTPANLQSTLNSAVAGDIILLSAGSYGGFSVEVSGQAGKPVVIRGQAGATITGDIGVFSRNHIFFDSVNVVGRIRYTGTNNFTIVRSTVQGTNAQGGDCIVSYTRAENAYIADNIVTGVTVWAESSLGVNGNNKGEGIIVNGPGHVIMNNRVSGFRDSISLMEDTESDDQHSIDIINNDISNSADDGIEADFCKHNCRIMRNRLTNSFIALSSQPSLGGPTYFIRNSVYNAVHLAFKLYRGSNGDVILHNTIVKNGDAFGVYAGRAVTNSYIANNLLIGGPGGTYNGYSSGSGKVISFPDLTTANSYINYQAYGNSAGTFAGTIGATSFTSLAQLRANTSEKNSIQVDLSVFNTTIAFPSAPMTQMAPADLRIKSGSATENAALVIPNINDGFSGAAPDIGAYEAGQALPVYGPR